jgi:hypothetical protein
MMSNMGKAISAVGACILGNFIYVAGWPSNKVHRFDPIADVFTILPFTLGGADDDRAMFS